MSKQPTRTYASAVGPCPTVIQIIGHPRTGSLPSTITPPDHPLHPEQPKLHRVLAVLSAIGLKIFFPRMLRWIYYISVKNEGRVIGQFDGRDYDDGYSDYEDDDRYDDDEDYEYYDGDYYGYF